MTSRDEYIKAHYLRAERPKERKKRRKVDTDSGSNISYSAAASSEASVDSRWQPIVPTKGNSKVEIVEGSNDDHVRMADGTKAGLQSASALREQLAEAAATAAAEAEDDADDVSQETVYRDATGRRIDVRMRREQLRREHADKVAAEQREQALREGAVQQRQRQERRENLERAKQQGIARYADDKEVNEILKRKIYWDDPMASATVRPPTDGATASVQHGRFTAPPNRYGISAGSRWDGVDRSNGFEQRLLRMRNEGVLRAREARAWAQADM